MDLQEPPAGKARNYSIRGKAVNAKASYGYTASYLTSVYGVVGVWRQSGNRLWGRYRMAMLHRQSTPWFGTSRPGTTVVLGEFAAVHDPEQGPVLREQATAPVGGGKPVPASKPASQPAGRATTKPAQAGE
jgi:hypothetical protein